MRKQSVKHDFYFMFNFRFKPIHLVLFINMDDDLGGVQNLEWWNVELPIIREFQNYEY